MHAGGPTRAEVHPSEVDEWQAHGWRAASGNEQEAKADGNARMDTIAAKIHDEWLADRRADGLDSIKSINGHELLVPYEQLADPIKVVARSFMRMVLAAPLPPFDQRPLEANSSAAEAGVAPQAVEADGTASTVGTNTSDEKQGQPEGTGEGQATGADTSAPANQDAPIRLPEAPANEEAADEGGEGGAEQAAPKKKKAPK